MIYVIRHGQTDLNKERRMQGRWGLPLNEGGMEQAQDLRTRLKGIKFDYVYSSPQERAIQTAEIVTGQKVLVDPRLDVFHLGEADRLKINEVKMAGMTPDSNVYKSVEDPYSFINRVFDFMKELETKYSYDEVNIFISGHRCTTGCIGAFFEGIPKDGKILRFSSNTGNFKIYNF
ncbi:histidine phosphatase family protein [Pseudoneobacillus sp. C159]